MQGGVIGGICLLAFLLSVGRAEELAGVKEPEDLKNIETAKEAKPSEDSKLSSELESSDDLKSELSLAVTDTNSQENEGRSGAMAHSSAHSYGGVSSSNAVAHSHGGGSSSAYSDSYAGASKSKATATAGYLPQATPTSPFSSDLSPYLPPSASSSQADAQAFNDVGSSYGQGLNSYPYTSSYPYNAGSSSAQAQAEADNGFYQPAPIATPILNTKPQALASSDLYRPILEPGQNPYKQGSFAQGQAQADNEYYQPAPIATPILSPYSQGSSAAKAQAQVDSDYYPPGSELNFQPFRQGPNIIPADSGLYQPENRPTPISNPYGQGASYAQAPADSGLYQPGAFPPSYLGPYKPGSSSAQTKAQLDRADGGSVAVNPYSLGLNQYANDYPAESPYRPAGFIQPESQTQSNAFASVQSSPIAFEDAKSRLISPDEYVFLNKMPGADNTIQCSKENEFHHYWSQTLDCLVCICLNEYGLLTPVCASCAGCHKPPPEPYPRLPEPIPVLPATPPPELPGPSQLMPVEPLPSPEPIPEPFDPNPVPNPPEPSPLPVTEPIPEPIPTLPPMLPGGSCSPLPSGQPFTNPLHPCQICVCQESYLTGKPDVQIQCKENPQCIAPADVTTLPPIPDLPVPIPLPLCEKFPEHVLFPHPTDGCKLCKCAKHLSDNGEPEQHITCYPHPDCVPKLEPITEPTSYAPPPLPVPIEPFLQNPFPPEPVPIPVEPLREPSQPLVPVPLPEIVTVEPLPWPPVSTTALVPTSVPTPPLTPRPGPLPGPSPHESCRPYPPNQAFQHPWDECQICMCSEATAVGMITVEVNCYTKPSCCIEPPDSMKPAIAGYSKPYPASNNPVNENIVIPIGSQPSALSTSTYRPAPVYPPYSPRPANIYPGSSQPTAPDVLPAYSPGTYTRIKPEDNYANQASYPYQPNYHPGYINPQYPDYPGRLQSPNGVYNQNNYGYPSNYQYSQGDAIGNAYPPPQGHYQPYEPRYQGLSAPNAYPPIYQRPNYEIPPYPPGISRDGYSIAQASAQGGPNALSTAQAQTGELLRSKIGNDVPDDLDDST